MRLFILLPAILTLTVSCTDTFFDAEPADTPVSVFDQTWQVFDQYYGPFDIRGVDWDEVHDAYRPQVNDQMTDDELYATITGMLNLLDDGHVQLASPGREYYYSSVYYREKIGYDLFDLEVIKEHYLNNEFTEGPYGFNIYGRIGDAVYLYMGDVGYSSEIIGEVLDNNQDATGLIVDLRHNEGGDFTYAFSHMTRFFDQKRLIFRSRSRNAPHRGSFDDWTEWSISPKGKYWDKPIVVLTDRFTISAGERAAMAFRQLPNSTFVGDTSNGAISTKISRELSNRWYVSLATQEVLNPDGSSYEGKGIPPDVHVVNTPGQLEHGVDEVLEAALLEI